MQRLNWQLRRLIVQDLALIVVVILVAVAAIALGADRVYVLPAAVLLILFLLALIGMYIFNTIRAIQTAQRIMTDDPWVHWHYDADEWERLVKDAEVQKRIKQQLAPWRRAFTRRIVIIGVVILIIFPLLFRDRGWQAILGGSVLGVALLGLLIRSALRSLHGLANIFPREEGAASELYIGPLGLVHPPQVILFNQPHLHLVDATIEDGAPSRVSIALQYELERGSRIPYDLLVPIPPGREEEAQSVVNHIRTTLTRKE
jgi:hypothetical protein